MKVKNERYHRTRNIQKSKMSSICVRVINSVTNKVMLSWGFIDIPPRKYSYEDLLKDILNNKFDHFKLDVKCRSLICKHGLCSTSHNLREEIIGQPHTDIADKVSKFQMLYFTVSTFHDDENCLGCRENQSVIEPVRPNAFAMMMSSARKQALDHIPTEIAEPKTGKERMYNALIRSFKVDGLCFPNRIGSVGKTYVNRLVNLLWNIDGHMLTIERESSRRIPEEFRKFQGFNCPEKSKHRKRDLGNLSGKALADLSLSLKEVIQGISFMDNAPWAKWKISNLQLCNVVDNYASYLREKNSKIQKIHLTPRSNFETVTNVKILPTNSREIYYQLRSLDNALKEVSLFHPISVREHLPASLHRKEIYNIVHHHLHGKGLSSKAVHYIYNPGGSKQALHFVWKVTEKNTETELINNSLSVIREIEGNVPTYERRITKREFKNAYGFVGSKVALRSIFKDLTGDKSSPCNITESEVDRRLNYALLCEDNGIIVDLRNQSPDKRKEKFAEFFKETESYLSNDIDVACHERRHGEQLYLAKAVSFNDLHKRIQELVPEGANIPSVKWLRYQFQPINPLAKTAAYYKGLINIKMMVQKRQLRVNHVDAHYCAASWKYMREYAIKHKDIVTLVSLDDKHKIKCGEPSYPVAAAERGKKVIVGENQVMAVADHDFTKFSIIPSVDFIIDIPDSITGSFYRGQVYVGFKNAISEASSALRHSCELKSILTQHSDVIPPVLLMYSDGGPDHRVTYMSVKLALIGLFRDLDLDLLIALRTAPSNSWANPVERIMSIVNIGLQGMGVMRAKGNDEFEKVVGQKNSVKELRDALTTDELKDELKASLSLPIELLNSQMQRLSLKERPFQTFKAVNEAELDEMWKKCEDIDAGVQRSKITKADMRNLPSLKRFMADHCKETHYCFQVKKCGKDTCEFCSPIRDERSKDLPLLPDPELAADSEHYKSFDEMYGKETKDNRPSLSVRPASKRQKLKFSPSVQHVKNTNVMMQCENCEKWRLVFSKKKLSKRMLELLQNMLENISFSCGFLFDDVQLPHGLEVYVKDHDCGDPIEKLYYSCGYEAICIYCGDYLEDADENADTYPQCFDCKDPEIRKREAAV